MYSVSQKNPPDISDIFSKRLEIFKMFYPPITRSYLH